MEDPVVKSWLPGWKKHTVETSRQERKGPTGYFLRWSSTSLSGTCSNRMFWACRSKAQRFLVKLSNFGWTKEQVKDKVQESLGTERIVKVVSNTSSGFDSERGWGTRDLFVHTGFFRVPRGFYWRILLIWAKDKVTNQIECSHESYGLRCRDGASHWVLVPCKLKPNSICTDLLRIRARHSATAGVSLSYLMGDFAHLAYARSGERDPTFLRLKEVSWLSMSAPHLCSSACCASGFHSWGLLGRGRQDRKQPHLSSRR